METDQLIEHMIELADEYMATDLKILQVTGLCSFTDYFILLSDQSSTQIQALSDAILRVAKKAGRKPQSAEGVQAGDWVLLDFGDAVIHIFTPEKREYYNLEGLWEEAPVVYPKDEAAETTEAE